MIKKIFVIIILCSLLFSCGKKGDPKYKVKNENTHISRV